MAEEPIELTTTKARAGSKGKQVRTILIVSICLVIVAFVATYIASL